MVQAQGSILTIEMMTNQLYFHCNIVWDAGTVVDHLKLGPQCILDVIMVPFWLNVNIFLSLMEKLELITISVIATLVLNKKESLRVFFIPYWILRCYEKQS